MDFNLMAVIVMMHDYFNRIILKLRCITLRFASLHGPSLRFGSRLFASLRVVPRIFAALRFIPIFMLLVSFFTGCAYFNSYYLAQKHFKDAEYQRKRDNGAVNNDAKTNYKEAGEWSGEVIRNYSDSRYVDDSFYILGMSSYYMKEYYDAIGQFNKLISLFPESKFTEEAQYYKARSHMEIDQNDQASMVFNELIKSSDRSMKGRAGLALAEISYNDKQWIELLDATQAVIDSDPEKDELVQSIVYKGEALYQLERYDECISALVKLIETKFEPELRFKSNSFIAQSKAKLGDFEDALGYLESLQNRGEFAPFGPKIRLEIGKIHEMNGNMELAVETYRNMAGDYPDSLAAKEAWYRVGMLLINDLSDAREAKDAFDKVKQGKVMTSELWFGDAQNKSAQIDSMNARLDRIEVFKDDSESRARTRFSLAELYTYSLDHPDSALTQYRIIMEEAPETEYAVRSDFFIRREELIKSERYSEETEREVMKEIIDEYPDKEFTQELKVYLGIIDSPPEIKAIRKAEIAKFSGMEPEVYMPLYQAVVDSFPDTRSAYQARFILAYSYEHDAGDIEKALELYKELTDEKPSHINREYVEKGREKLEYYASEPRMLKEIEKYLAGYVSEDKVAQVSENIEQQSKEITGTDTGLTGYRKIRDRNARIRSRYYTD
ncbi:tetratricopeptide repeat protein [Candidatus Latescibacterota bacterium]